MRKLILTAALFIGMGTMAFAQNTDSKREQKTPEERAQRATDMLDKKLSLSADQKSKIYALNLDGMKKMKANHVKGEKRDRSAMKAAMEERDNKINNILNEKQRVTYKELQEKRKDAMKKHTGKMQKKGDKADKV